MTKYFEIALFIITLGSATLLTANCGRIDALSGAGFINSDSSGVDGSTQNGPGDAVSDPNTSANDSGNSNSNNSNNKNNNNTNTNTDDDDDDGDVDDK